MAQGGGISVFIGTRGGATVLAVAAIAAAVVLTPVITGGGGTTITCNQTAATASQASLTTAISAASNGQTVCMSATGDYGTFAGTSKTVTIISQSGTGAPSPVANSMDLNLGSGDTGFTIDGGLARWDSATAMSIDGGTISTGATNITLKNFKSHGCSSNNCRSFIMDPAPGPNANIVIDHFYVHDDKGEATFYIWSAASNNTGITIKNGLLRNVSTDGFKLSNPVKVNVVNNRIIDSHCTNGWTQNECDNDLNGANHTDGIQYNSGDDSFIRGNWITDCDGALFGDDGTSGLTIEHNIVQDCDSQFIMTGGDFPGSTVRHNLVVDTSGSPQPAIDCGGTNGSLHASETSFYNNISRDINLSGSPNCTPTRNDHNLCFAGCGASNITGSPTYSGGADPTTFDSFSDFCLSPASTGYTGADDGGQVGPCGGDYNAATDGPPSGEGF